MISAETSAKVSALPVGLASARTGPWTSAKPGAKNAPKTGGPGLAPSGRRAMIAPITAPAAPPRAARRAGSATSRARTGPPESPGAPPPATATGR
jgi:hypothetical protein